MPHWPPFVLLPHRAKMLVAAGEGAYQDPGSSRLQLLSAGLPQPARRCPRAPPPPPTSSGIGYLGLGGRPQGHDKVGGRGRRRSLVSGATGHVSVRPVRPGGLQPRALAAPQAEFPVPLSNSLASPRPPGPAFFGGKSQSPGLGALRVSEQARRAGPGRRGEGCRVGTRAGRDPGGARGLQEAGAAAARAPARRGKRHPETDSTWVPARGGVSEGAGGAGGRPAAE